MRELLLMTRWRTTRVGLVIGLLLVFTHTYAQKIGINEPNPKVTLDINGTDAINLPRGTNAQRPSGSDLQEGALRFNTSSKLIEFYDGISWITPGTGGGDNLGNHIATQNIRLNDNWLSNDGSNTGIRISNDGKVGIGISGPAHSLHIANNNAATELAISRAGNNYYSGAIMGLKLRGTQASPAAINSGDDLLLIQGLGHDGTSLVEAARITLESEGTISTNRIPGRILFHTRTDESSSTLKAAMVLSSDGSLSIGKSHNNADLSAIVDIVSTNKGILFPRLTTSQRNNITDPAEGLMVFNNSYKVVNYVYTKCIDVYLNGAWRNLACADALKEVFDFTGSLQSWTVPDGVTTIYVKLWGGGGAGGNNSGGQGGGGAYVAGTLAVTPGESLQILVGGGGVNNNSTSAFGGGGPASSDNRGGGGGGRSALIRNGVEIAIAGGGGGGGNTTGSAHGGGGGAAGSAGINGSSGSCGGSGGQANGAGGSGGTGATNGGNGTSWNGTNGGSGGAGANQGSGRSGGGGGGGYGGGGGGCGANSNSGGGGGGSSAYLSLTTPRTSEAASGRTPGGNDDPDNGGKGWGGTSAGQGIPGRVVIYY